VVEDCHVVARGWILHSAQSMTSPLQNSATELHTQLIRGLHRAMQKSEGDTNACIASGISLHVILTYLSADNGITQPTSVIALPSQTVNYRPSWHIALQSCLPVICRGLWRENLEVLDIIESTTQLQGQWSPFVRHMFVCLWVG
jgi:hypothetical protein